MQVCNLFPRTADSVCIEEGVFVGTCLTSTDVRTDAPVELKAHAYILTSAGTSHGELQAGKLRALMDLAGARQSLISFCLRFPCALQAYVVEGELDLNPGPPLPFQTSTFLGVFQC